MKTFILVMFFTFIGGGHQIVNSTSFDSLNDCNKYSYTVQYYSNFILRIPIINYNYNGKRIVAVNTACQEINTK